MLNANKNTLSIISATAKDEDQSRITHTARASGGFQKFESEHLPAWAPVMLIPETNQINKEELEDIVGEGHLSYLV